MNILESWISVIYFFLSFLMPVATRPWKTISILCKPVVSLFIYSVIYRIHIFQTHIYHIFQIFVLFCDSLCIYYYIWISFVKLIYIYRGIIIVQSYSFVSCTKYQLIVLHKLIVFGSLLIFLILFIYVFCFLISV